MQLLKNKSFYAFSSVKSNSTVKLEIENFLTQLFNDKNKRIILARTFKIFPAYFSEPKLSKFLNDDDLLNESIEYLTKRKYNSPVSSSLDQILKKQLEIKTIKQRKMLEIFINYLKQREDLTKNQLIMEMFDLKTPHQWFDKSKIKGKRKFIYHHGPTNSGKTFSAIKELQQLNEDQKGIYMAPLRLLAWETQQKLGNCNLITGQQKQYRNSHLTSCTVEAAPLTDLYEVAIIDEIQMIADISRGWSWTKAVLAVNAKKIHLCGDERALKLISEIVREMGDQLEEKTYNRLSKLQFNEKLFKMDDLTTGDCLVDFSFLKLQKMKKLINKQKQKNQTAIIYGKLPPSCRKQQAHKFNTHFYPYIVASNAIGMGLNLNIRRIIFTSLQRMNFNKKKVKIQDHQIRQIAGRAGRGYGHGQVQCTDKWIRKNVKKALKNVNVTYKNQEHDQVEENRENTKSEIYYCESLGRMLTEDECKIKQAAIFFPYSIVERIKDHIENILDHKIKLSQAIQIIEQLSQLNEKLYCLVYFSDFNEIAENLEPLDLELEDQFKFCSLPYFQSVSKKTKQAIDRFVKEFQSSGKVMVPHNIAFQAKKNFNRSKGEKGITFLQELHMILDAYTWYSNFYELQFLDVNRVNSIKAKICERLSEQLNSDDVQS